MWRNRESSSMAVRARADRRRLACSDAHQMSSTGGNMTSSDPGSAQSFLLQRVQPAMTGLIDGSLSTLAPIFTVALATHRPLYAFCAGLATAIGAGVSMAFSEGLSDTGDLTGRGSPYLRAVDE